MSHATNGPVMPLRGKVVILKCLGPKVHFLHDEVLHIVVNLAILGQPVRY